MNRKHVSLCVGLLILATSLTVWAAPQAATDSLYKRLGGYDAIAAVSDDFLGRLANDPSLGRYFVGVSTDSLGKLRQHVVDFLCKATGGPCVYHGRDMKTTHAGLKITEKDWTDMVKHLNATLDKFKVPDKERGEVLGAVAGLKADIVEEKKKM
jgi:hemoglobin